MGKIIKISTKKIRPSQDFLKEDTIKFILTCYFENRKELLPPTPIVRYNPQTDEYIAIDGHNLIAIKDLFKEECEVYVAENKLDIFDTSAKGRNQELKAKFDKVINDQLEISKEGISSFTDLRNLFPYLQNQNLVKDYYAKNNKDFINKYLANR